MSAPGKAETDHDAAFNASVLGGGMCLITLLLIAAVVTNWFGKGAGQTVATWALVASAVITVALYFRVRGGQR